MENNSITSIFRNHKLLIVGAGLLAIIGILIVLVSIFSSLLGARSNIQGHEVEERLVGGHLDISQLTGTHTLEFRGTSSDGQPISDTVTFEATTVTKIPNLPDLIIDSISVPDHAIQIGDSPNIGVTIKNQGTVVAQPENQSSDIKIQLEIDLQSDGSYETRYNNYDFPTARGVGSVQPNGTGQETFSLPAINIGGTHTIRICADKAPITSLDNQIAESNEDNNCATAQLVVGQSPDLAVSNVRLNPAAPHVNQQTTVTATVNNAGAGASRAAQLLLCRQNSHTRTERCESGYYDLVEGESQIPVIAAGASADVSITFSPDFAGSLGWQVCIAGSSNIESGGRNNCADVDFTVTAN